MPVVILKQFRPNLACHYLCVDCTTKHTFMPVGATRLLYELFRSFLPIRVVGADDWMVSDCSPARSAGAGPLGYVFPWSWEIGVVVVGPRLRACILLLHSVCSLIVGLHPTSDDLVFVFLVRRVSSDASIPYRTQCQGTNRLLQNSATRRISHRRVVFATSTARELHATPIRITSFSSYASAPALVDVCLPCQQVDASETAKKLEIHLRSPITHCTLHGASLSDICTSSTLVQCAVLGSTHMYMLGAMPEWRGFETRSFFL
jgi:hypothetical protein